jgi:hypothetical protein
MTDSLKAWHFLREDGCLRYEPHTKVEVGQTLKYNGFWPTSQQGYHASVRAMDALKYAPGPIVCRVELGGVIVEEKDKAVASERTVLAMANASTVLHEFACDIAEACLRKHGVTDERSWVAIETKRKWVKGEATDEELFAATGAARAAVRAAQAVWAIWVVQVALAREAGRAAQATAREAAETEAEVAAQNIDLEKRLRGLLGVGDET